MTIDLRNRIEALGDVLQCSTERAHLVLTVMNWPDEAARVAPAEALTCMISQKLRAHTCTETGPHHLLSPTWILSLACGHLPTLTQLELEKLALFLDLSPVQLCELLYPAGHGPGSGAFYAEFPFLAHPGRDHNHGH